ENGGIVYGYQNTGNAGSPTWTAHAAWNSADIGSTAQPTLADLDNDGDFDLLIGDSGGTSQAYQNTGTRASPTWTDAGGWDAPDVGNNAAPALGDLDGDGDFDLMIGTSLGECQAYRNTGSVTSPTWTNNDAWDAPDIGTSSAPVIVDIDNTLNYIRQDSGTTEIGYDLAERFRTRTTVEPGDILSIAVEGRLAEKGLTANRAKILGVVSEAPAILFDGSQLEIAPTAFSFQAGTRPPVALAGRAVTKVCNRGGPIESGDPITVSDLPGVGMKANDPGRIVGIALESFDQMTATPCTERPESLCGKIRVFMNPHWYGGIALEGDSEDRMAAIKNLIVSEKITADEIWLANGI
ncbi:MAG: VCBS repeat-containing protein, partial [Leptospiraceae bacterium]|nr:VCBS repeat-containing protein [Leptospiraceae bacterium]